MCKPAYKKSKKCKRLLSHIEWKFPVKHLRLGTLRVVTSCLKLGRMWRELKKMLTTNHVIWLRKSWHKKLRLNEEHEVGLGHPPEPVLLINLSLFPPRLGPPNKTHYYEFNNFLICPLNKLTFYMLFGKKSFFFHSKANHLHTKKLVTQ